MTRLSRLRVDSLAAVSNLDGRPGYITTTDVFEEIVDQYNRDDAPSRAAIYNSLEDLGELGFVHRYRANGRDWAFEMTDMGYDYLRRRSSFLGDNRIDVSQFTVEEAKQLYDELSHRFRKMDDHEPVRDCQDCSGVQLRMHDFRTGEPFWVCQNSWCDRRDDIRTGGLVADD